MDKKVVLLALSDEQAEAVANMVNGNLSPEYMQMQEENQYLRARLRRYQPRLRSRI